jgi:hypothetical protein
MPWMSRQDSRGSVDGEEREFLPSQSCSEDSLSIDRHDLVDSDRHPLATLATHNRHARIQRADRVWRRTFEIQAGRSLQTRQLQRVHTPHHLLDPLLLLDFQPLLLFSHLAPLHPHHARRAADGREDRRDARAQRLVARRSRRSRQHSIQLKTLVNQLLNPIPRDSRFRRYTLKVLRAPELIRLQRAAQTRQVEDKTGQRRAVQSKRVVHIRQQASGVQQADREFRVEGVRDYAARAAARVGPVALAVEEALQPEEGGARGGRVGVFVVGRVGGAGEVVGGGFGFVVEFDHGDEQGV